MPCPWRLGCKKHEMESKFMNHTLDQTGERGKAIFQKMYFNYNLAITKKHRLWYVEEGLETVEDCVNLLKSKDVKYISLKFSPYSLDSSNYLNDDEQVKMYNSLWRCLLWLIICISHFNIDFATMRARWRFYHSVLQSSYHDYYTIVILSLYIV